MWTTYLFGEQYTPRSECSLRFRPLVDYPTQKKLIACWGRLASAEPNIFSIDSIKTTFYAMKAPVWQVRADGTYTTHQETVDFGGPNESSRTQFMSDMTYVHHGIQILRVFDTMMVIVM